MTATDHIVGARSDGYSELDSSQVQVQNVAEAPTVVVDVSNAFGDATINEQDTSLPALGNQFQQAAVVATPPPAPEPVTHPAKESTSFEAKSEPTGQVPQTANAFNNLAPTTPDTPTQTGIVTNENVAHNASVTHDNLQVAAQAKIEPLSETLDTVFDLFGSTKEVSEVLPEPEVQVAEVTQKPSPIQNNWDTLAKSANDSTYDIA